jgi:hypothetical protein
MYAEYLSQKVRVAYECHFRVMIRNFVGLKLLRKLFSTFLAGDYVSAKLPSLREDWICLKRFAYSRNQLESMPAKFSKKENLQINNKQIEREQGI